MLTDRDAIIIGCKGHHIAPAALAFHRLFHVALELVIPGETFARAISKLHAEEESGRARTMPVTVAVELAAIVAHVG